MKRRNLLVAFALGLGVFMMILDSLSGPSQSLLAANSTMMLAVTIITVALLASPGAKPLYGSQGQVRSPTRGTPLNETTEQLKGASKGYTLNRKEIAQTLRAAVNVKIGSETNHLPNEASDAFLMSILGDQTFAEFFSEDGWKATRVSDSISYLARLKAVVVALTKSLES